jgi:ATP/maltotriose-dependent transcriptional regulator MalT
MSYDNLSSVSQNVLKFYQQLTGEERRIPFIFDDFHLITQVIIRHRVQILFSVISSPITLERQK